MEVPRKIKEKYPNAEIHWITKSEFADVVRTNPYVDKVWPYNRNKGLRGLFFYIRVLRKEKYKLVYDLHNNLRSNILTLPLRLISRLFFIQKKKHRFKRFLFFKLNKRHLFPQPYQAMQEYLKPLGKLGINSSTSKQHSLKLTTPKRLEGLLPTINKSICLAPGGAWPLKRWPVTYWQKLVRSFPETPLIILGGPADRFTKDIETVATGPSCLNLTGKLTWVETIWVISQSRGVISSDTGALHISDFLGKTSLGLIGPTAFGHPSRASSHYLQADLPCRPCTKHGDTTCKNETYKKCLFDLTPEMVKDKSNEIF